MKFLRLPQNLRPRSTLHLPTAPPGGTARLRPGASALPPGNPRESPLENSQEQRVQRIFFSLFGISN